MFSCKKTSRNVPGLLLACLPIALVLVLSCSKSTDPDTNKPPNNDTVGVLLSGDASANAVGQTEGFIAAIPSVILNDATGLVANKVSAVISPSATVGQINSLLDSMDSRIICMDDASVFLTLSIPATGTTEELDSLTLRLVRSEPFLFAFPCFIPIPPTPAEPDPELPLLDIPGEPAASNIAHLKACYMPAAWNAMSRANSVNRQVTVLVPDAYARLTPHAELPGQEFVAIPGDGADVRIDAASSTALGNHGFYVSGILGAEYDDIGATGIHPGKSNLIRIRSLNVGSDEWGVKLQQISNAIPSGSQTLVSTSLGYNDPAFNTVSKWQRILLALKWRELVGEKQTQFLHLTSSGNDGRTTGEGALSVFNSPLTMAAQMVSPWDWLGAGEYTEADSLGYVQLQQLYGTTKPYLFQPLTNALVIGSSRLNGARSAFSNVGADVRFVGERVFCPCVTNDATCIDGFGTPSGTSMTAPQAAGLAAYLMNLKPILTPLQARQAILNSYDNARGIVNSYKAVLSLDDGLTNATVRKAILNVADTTAGTFDEKDIEAFLRVIDEPQYTRDYSRFDLNGDGWTGGPTTAPFDLDINSPPAYTTVSIFPCDDPEATARNFDENAVTDREILLYYAFSPMYTGSDSVRSELFGINCNPYWVGDVSSYVREFVYFPALNIYEDDTSSGAALSFNIDETRDSISPYCKDTAIGFRWQLTSNCNASLGASAGSASVSVDGSASLLSRATATAPIDPSGCRYNIQGGHSSIKAVRFALSGDAISAPFSLVVSGIVQPTSSAHSITEIARCVVELHIVDTTLEAQFAGAAAQQQPAFLTFDSDLNPLPFQLNSALSPLSENRVYELKVYAQTMAIAATQLYPGPNEAKVDINISLFVGE